MLGCGLLGCELLTSLFDGGLLVCFEVGLSGAPFSDGEEVGESKTYESNYTSVFLSESCFHLMIPIIFLFNKSWLIGIQ